MASAYKSSQQIFDEVVTALRKQGRPSVNEAGGCLYRGPDGLKCAAGHLIPDDAYSPGMEGESVWQPEVLGALRRAGVAGDLNQHLVSRLQSAHDNAVGDALNGVATWLAAFETEAASIAADHRLTYTPAEPA